MKGLQVGDQVAVRGTITEVNADGSYTVELSTRDGFLAMLFLSMDVHPFIKRGVQK